MAPGRYYAAGLGAVAVLDLALALALRARSRAPAAVVAEAFAFLLLQQVAVALAAWAAVDAVDRLAARWPRAAAPAIAWLGAIAIGAFVLEEDLSVFAPTIASAATAAAAVPFAALVLVRRRLVSARGAVRWATAPGLGAIAIGIAAQNHTVLDVTYPGIHFTTFALAGGLLGLALELLLAPRLTAFSPPPWARRAGAGGLATIAVLGATALVISPRNASLTELARIPVASIPTFVARLRGAGGSASRAEIAPSEAAWFAPRDAAPPAPPSKERIVAGPPVVIVVTIDSLRADVLAHEAAGAPYRRLARQGVWFRQARSPSSSTFSTLATVFTGRYFSSLRWRQRSYRDKVKFFLHEDRSVQFPELLRDAGVRSVVVPTVEAFLPEHGLLRGLEPISEVHRASSADAVARVAQFLDEVGSRPAFLWTHLMDSHYPYGEGRGQSKKKYLREIERMGELVLSLSRAIGAHPVGRRALLVVTADHGEAFGEHGTRHHATTVYEELVHVPLFVVGKQLKRRTIDEPVSLIDLGPTVLDVFGLDTPGTYLGQSWVPLLAKACAEQECFSRPIVLDSGRRKQALISRDGWKVIRNVSQRSSELYELTEDPRESRNLVDERPEEAARRLGKLAAFFDAHELREPGYRIPSRE